MGGIYILTSRKLPVVLIREQSSVVIAATAVTYLTRAEMASVNRRHLKNKLLINAALIVTIVAIATGKHAIIVHMKWVQMFGFNN